MIPRILSIAGPVVVYVTLGIFVTGLWRERRKLEWLALVPATAGLLASFIFLPAVHRLFFDEDVYISIARNLTRAPVAQITLLGGPNDVQVATYHKEPPGWPVILSLVFVIAGRSEGVAFIAARLLFALAIAGVYQLAREIFEKRRALLAAILFGAAPVCFWFSPSTGTDIPSALAAAMGTWGILAGNGMLAAAGFALAAQMRLELIVLIPLVWLSPKIPSRWKWMAAVLVIVQVVHIGWVISIAPALAAAEKVQSAFGFRYVLGNLAANVGYILNPLVFPAAVTVLALGALWKELRKVRSLFLLQILLVFGVYLFFYAGSFDINPRYTIQFLIPLTLIAASLVHRPVIAGLVLSSMTLPYTRPLELPTYVQALAADHGISTRFADRLGPNDLIISTEPEMFLNYDKRAMSALYASQYPQKLEEQLRQRKVIYHSGVRANRPDTEEWGADQWVKSHFELHLIESQEIRGLRISFYETLLKNLDREAR